MIDSQGFIEYLENLAFGRQLQSCRLAFIDDLKDCQNILILGEGDGRMMLELLKRYPQLRITSLDNSQAMLRCSQKRLNKHQLLSDRLEFIHADALRYHLPVERFDGLISLFFLDNFTESQLEKLIPRLSASLKQGGKFYQGDFCLPQGFWASFHAKAWLWVMYLFFNLLTDISSRKLAEPQAYFLAAGLKCLKRQERFLGMLYTELWLKP
ncbi:MAG: class I SAM-dependent methyltransferase [Deinococcales bacterium]